MKTKLIRLSHPHSMRIGQTNEVDDKAYRVEQVTDSTEYSPRELLSKLEVDELCNCNRWKVTIVSSKEV
jgi:hypothetical protein